MESISVMATAANLIFADSQRPITKTLKDKKNLPKKISLLRLDTDWYDSTKVELDILYPKLIKGGILIIDDYGDMKGAKKAVDEFFNKQLKYFQ